MKTGACAYGIDQLAAAQGAWLQHPSSPRALVQLEWVYAALIAGRPVRSAHGLPGPLLSINYEIRSRASLTTAPTQRGRAVRHEKQWRAQRTWCHRERCHVHEQGTASKRLMHAGLQTERTIDRLEASRLNCIMPKDAAHGPSTSTGRWTGCRSRNHLLGMGLTGHWFLGGNYVQYKVEGGMMDLVHDLQPSGVGMKAQMST